MPSATAARRTSLVACSVLALPPSSPRVTARMPSGSRAGELDEQIEARLDAGEGDRYHGTIAVCVERLQRIAPGQALGHEARVEQMRQHPLGRRGER